MRPNARTCLFLRPPLNNLDAMSGGKYTLQRFEEDVCRSLTKYRRDGWHIVHYFPEWPSNSDWPRLCPVRSTEPVFHTHIGAIKIPATSIEIAVLGVASAAILRSIKSVQTGNVTQIATDPQGFRFSDYIDSPG